MPKIEIPDQFYFEEAIKRSMYATCQFLSLKKGTQEFPAPNGCGVFIEINKKYYCLSNAHVLGDEKFGKTFILSENNEKIILGGKIFTSSLPSSGYRKDDTLDVAVINLSDITVDKLRELGYVFINYDEIITGYTLISEDRIFIIGFPGNKTKIDNIKRKVKGEPLLSRTVPFLTNLSTIGYPSQLHHFVKYSRNILIDLETNKNKIGPKPHGISGSGVWLIGKSKHFLIGIFTEYFENRALLASTKIDLFIDLIRQKFDLSIVNNGVTVNLG